jgi:2-polyprenyl-6-methoxyphenol hydroxylase-like FAD-dependent oxidoreductase
VNGSENRVLIIGGGIGGLAVALALQRVGIEVAVFEKSREIREVGAGLAIWANAIKALEQIGVGEAVLAAGAEMHDYQFRSADGETLIRVSIDDMTQKVGAPSICIRRADMQNTLYRALDEGVVRLGANCVGFTQDDGGVTARFADGREERGGLLIGADGIKSVTRDTQFGPTRLRYSGYKCWRSITPFGDSTSFPLGSWWLLWGRGARFGMSYVGGGNVYWYAMVNAPEGASDPAEGRKRRVLEAFRGWSAPVQALIEATPEASIIPTDLYDVVPIPRWGTGRVTLLGDAAHATTPNLGQGACQAIEDAVILAKDLAMSKGLSDCATAIAALRRYEARRHGRASRITNLSWRIGIVGQWENPAACAIRNRFMKLLPNSLMRKSLESNLAYDA